MPYPITAVVIPPVGDIRAVTITDVDPLGQFQRLVGGDIEAPSPSGSGRPATCPRTGSTRGG